MKAGWKSTEFYVMIAVIVFGALMSSGVVSDGHWAAQLIGGALTLLGGGTYIISRSGVKRADSHAKAYASRPLIMAPANGNEVSAPAEDPTAESA